MYSLVFNHEMNTLRISSLTMTLLWVFYSFFCFGKYPFISWNMLFISMAHQFLKVKR